MKKLLSLALLCSVFTCIFTIREVKSAETSDFGVNFSGFIRYDAHYDTRQVVSAREGSFLLYPTPEKLNKDNKDDNADPFLNFTSFITRGRVKITSPDVCGAKVSGFLESDFYGSANDYVSNLVLRHAYTELNWGSLDLVLGQYWSPLFTADVIPQTINFNTGAPFNPFARLPMAKLTYKPIEQFEVLFATTMQRDAFEDKPSKLIEQRAGIPALHLHTSFINEKNTKIGLGGEIKTLKPEQLSDTFQTWAATAYGKFKFFDVLSLQLKGIYGNDLQDHLMLGGYVKTEDKKYKPLNIFSGWADLNYDIDKVFSIGLFSGYTSNLGASENLKVANPSESSKEIDVKDTNGVISKKTLPADITGRGTNISYLLRVNPRIVANVNKVKFALEFGPDLVLYTKEYDNQIMPKVNIKDTPMMDFRVLFSTVLSF